MICFLINLFYFCPYKHFYYLFFNIYPVYSTFPILFNDMYILYDICNEIEDIENHNIIITTPPRRLTNPDIKIPPTVTKSSKKLK